MSAFATFYLSETGEIVRVNEMADPLEIFENLRPGEGWVPGEFHGATHYVTDGAAIERPSIPAPAGATYDLAQLPAGSVLTVTDEEGHTTEVPAQSDTLELTDAGTYRLRSVSPFPYLDFDVEVTV